MAGLFDKLPFNEAIDALAGRLALIKDETTLTGTTREQFTGRDFLSLDAANRSRAFTMARISDQLLLENIHDELSIIINDGGTYADFEKRLRELQERSGWTGTSPWHYRLVYDQNLGMAFSAGRVQQGQESGLRAWKYLPSLSDNPRSSHAAYYNQVFRMAPGSPVPPIDFNCNCGWEWMLEEDLDGVDIRTLPVFDPPKPDSGFVWSATDYFDTLRTVQFNSAQPSGLAEGRGLMRLFNAATEATSNEVRTWFEAAVQASAEIGVQKFDRLMHWAVTLKTRDDISTLRAIRERIDDARRVVADEDEVELMHQATLAALLAGRVTVAEKVSHH